MKILLILLLIITNTISAQKPDTVYNNISIKDWAITPLIILPSLKDTIIYPTTFVRMITDRYYWKNKKKQPWK